MHLLQSFEWIIHYICAIDWDHVLKIIVTFYIVIELSTSLHTFVIFGIYSHIKEGIVISLHHLSFSIRLPVLGQPGKIEDNPEYVLLRIRKSKVRGLEPVYSKATLQFKKKVQHTGVNLRSILTRFRKKCKNAPT